MARPADRQSLKEESADKEVMLKDIEAGKFRSAIPGKVARMTSDAGSPNSNR
jgi:hypothetical protein